MRLLKALPALLGLVVVGACNDLNVPDLNNPGLDELQTNPTRGAVLAATSGLLVGSREGHADPNGYVSLLGILGRESYNFDVADPRFVTQMLITGLDGGTPAFGGNLWADPYANIRGANIILNALDIVPQVTDEEKAAIRGFARTIQALDFLYIINTRDAIGAAVDVDREPTGEPAPILSKSDVFDHIEQLLGDARTDLAAAGSSFPFPLSTGYAGFDTPSTFLQFNWALQARVDVYRGQFTEALTALGSSFLDPNAPLTLGVYHTYGTGSGDVTNDLFDPTGSALVAHPALETDAQLQSDGVTLDQRFIDKVIDLGEARTDQASQGLSTTLAFRRYGSITAPLPIIRNEELILLRAEANLGLNQDAAALTDIDFIRTSAGGLPAFGSAAWLLMTDEEQLDELLYNKRYSLMYEGHRWIDVRRYSDPAGRDRLAELGAGEPSNFEVFDHFPFPSDECLARTQSPPFGGC